MCFGKGSRNKNSNGKSKWYNERRFQPHWKLGGRRDHKSNHYPPPHPHLLELEEILWTILDSYRT